MYSFVRWVIATVQCGHMKGSQAKKNDIEGAIRDIKERHPKATKLDFIKILTQD